ncbi:class III lanthipeptide [Candidatus Galacturonibacter soehngenii]|nr:class III lanthipeptide [Candidatus Galacturonibacter soehngenii]
MSSYNIMNTILHLQSLEFVNEISEQSNISIGCKEVSTLSWFACVITK